MHSKHKPRLHIIIYSPFPSYSGGRENWLFNILVQFDKENFPVTVYSYRTNRPKFYNLCDLNSVRMKSVFTLRYWYDLYQVANILSLRLLHLLDSFIIFPYVVGKALENNLMNEDIVLAMNPIVDIYPAIQLKRRGKQFKLLCSVRGRVALEQSIKMPWLRSKLYKMEKETLLNADRVLSNGHDTQEYLQSIGINSQVIPNGVDVAGFAQPRIDDPDLDQFITWKTAGIKILTSVATLRSIKGVDDFIIGLHQLKNITDIPFKGVIVGKGSQLSYKRMAENLGLKDEIVFLGEQTNISGILHYSDVYICLSGGSGMSMALLEGMAAGKGIVAWNTPVYTQLIRHEESGILVPYRNHYALAESIYQLLKHPEFATSLGIEAKSVSQNYDWKTIAQNLMVSLNG